MGVEVGSEEEGRGGNRGAPTRPVCVRWLWFLWGLDGFPSLLCPGSLGLGLWRFLRVLFPLDWTLFRARASPSPSEDDFLDDLLTVRL